MTFRRSRRLESVVDAVGNTPLVRLNKVTRHVPDAGSYAPVTILIQELAAGGTRLAYDSVVSAIAIYDDPAAGQVAENLDTEVLGLLRLVSGLSPRLAL